MKFFLGLILVFVMMISCNKKTNEQVDKDISIMIPESGCYLSVMGNDSIWLKTEVFPNVVTGTLRYDFSEKDDNEGTFEGKLYGDTLVASYQFYSEGKISTREVAFKLSKDTAVEGYGDVSENENGFVFENFRTINFTSGTTFNAVSCSDYDRQYRVYPFVENKGGSEELYSRVWEVFSLNEKPLSNELSKRPFLAFTPGQVNTVTGNAGCNDIRGTFEIAENHQMKFAPLAATKMMCDHIAVENELIKLLGKVTHWSYENEILVLKNGSRPVIQLIPKK